MLFSYKAVDVNGEFREGTVDAQNMDAAIETVKQRGYTITSIEPMNEAGSLFNMEITWFERVSGKEVVILSRQIATLFDAQVSALRIFRLLAAEAENPLLQRVLTDVADQLQSGSSISRALSAHPKIFSNFYVSMVRAGEESGSLSETFLFLADYFDRLYDITSKTQSALIYPAFVIGVFVVVMMLMMTLVIPNIAEILLSSGEEIPLYTQIVIAISGFFANNIGIILIGIVLLAIVLWQFARTEVGARTLDEVKLTTPALGNLYSKLYLTRICDNLATMLASGISMVQALEVTADVVDNAVYREILEQTIIDVKGGKSFADAIVEYPEIPGVLSQMAKVGEETGKLGEILKTLASFYHREVNTAVDTIIDLIEPIMIVVLGLGVGILVASVLLPIYSITAAI